MQVSVEHLSKMYGAQRAVDDLSFEVKAGEILGFLGPNGAGKTTTMKIITGYIPASSGRVRVGDWDVAEHSLEARRHIGYLPEHNPLYLDMYVHEFLAFSARLCGLKQAQPRIAEVIEMTGLGREQHKKIGALSKGYRQRVGLCHALIHDPGVLILDEPTSGLDPNQIVEIRELIRKVGREKTVIFSSHILSEVEAVASRVLIINRGKKVADAPASELARLLGRQPVTYLEVDREGLDLSEAATWPGLSRIEQLSPLRFALHTEAGADLRSRIAQHCVAKGFTPTELRQDSFSLEDIFRSLTQAGA